MRGLYEYAGDELTPATERAMEQYLVEVKRRWPAVKRFHLHMHNARGMALPAIYAALRTLGYATHLESFGDDTASIRAFGLDVVTRLCDDLLSAGAPGLHFYTLNQAGLTTTIWQRLGL